MLEALFKIADFRVLECQGRIEGWAAFHRFGRGYVIGPVVATNQEFARSLIATLICEHGSQFLRIDILASSQLSGWLAAGLPAVSEVVTMARGPLPVRGRGASVYALANQALG